MVVTSIDLYIEKKKKNSGTVIKFQGHSSVRRILFKVQFSEYGTLENSHAGSSKRMLLVTLTATVFVDDRK